MPQPLKRVPLTLSQRYKNHVADWKDCQRCKYSKTRRKVVLGKGSVPAHVVFVGEAPGGSEDAHGVPFIGQAGMEFAKWLKRAVPDGVRVAINNLTGCLPVDEDGEKGEPDVECIEACSPRIREFIELANPLLIVTVGKHPEKWLDQKGPKHKKVIKLSAPYTEVPRVAIVHPAAVLRSPYVSRDMMVKQAVLVVQAAIAKHVTPFLE